MSGWIIIVAGKWGGVRICKYMLPLLLLATSVLTQPKLRLSRIGAYLLRHKLSQVG